MKKKVLMIGPGRKEQGGVVSVVNQIMEFKFNNEIEIEYITTYIKKNKIVQMMQYFYSIIKVFFKCIFKKYMAIHIHMSYKGSFYRKRIIVNICKITGQKVILHIHGSEFEEFFEKSSPRIQRSIKMILEKADIVIALGIKWKSKLEKISDKAVIINLNNSIKIEDYRLKENDNKILFLGSLIKRKGVYDILDAVKILKDRGILYNEDIIFQLGGVGEEEDGIRMKIKEYSLENNIELLGWVSGDYKDDLLKKAKIFILPSYNEGLPIAILEAMSKGIPTISTCVGSIEEAIINEENGYIIKPGDVYRLADLIEELIIDKNRYWRFSKNAYNHIKLKFNEKEYELILKDIYNKLEEKNDQLHCNWN